MSLYNLRRLAPDTFMICKFSDDFEVESTYTLTAKGFSYTCDCPANNRTVITKPCRHKLMMPTLLPAVDTDRFYDHDTGKFCEPLGDLADLRSEVDLTAEEIEALPDGVEKDFQHALQVEGEAPPSPSLPSQGEQLAPASAMLGTSAPTIRRR